MNEVVGVNGVSVVALSAVNMIHRTIVAANKKVAIVIATQRRPRAVKRDDNFNINRQRVVHAGVDPVGNPGFDHVFDAIVDVVDIVVVHAKPTAQGVDASTAIERVGTGAAFERIVACAAVECVAQSVADDSIVQRIAGAVVGSRPAEDQLFDVVRQGVIAPDVDRVDAFAYVLMNEVVGVNGVSVVALSAVNMIHRTIVAADKKVDIVIPTQRRTRAVKRDDDFNIGRQRVVHAGVDPVGNPSFDHVFDDVVDVVDIVGVRAKPTAHGIGTGASIKKIGASIAGDDVIEIVAGAVDGTGASQQQVLHIGGQAECD